jgi:hypothetical protein
VAQHAHLVFRFDAAGSMTTTNEPDGDPAPRVFLVRGHSTYLIHFRGDVPGSTAVLVRAAAGDLPVWTGHRSDASLFEPIRRALARDTPVAELEIGPAFVFDRRPEPTVGATALVIGEHNAHLLQRHFPYTRAMLTHLTPVTGVVRDGAVVAACYSARSSPSAREAGVWTEEAWRGRGFGTLVVATWRDEVVRTGAQPLYSTSWDNAASLALARRLGLRAYAETVSFR